MKFGVGGFAGVVISMSRFRTHLSTKVIFVLGLLAIVIVNCGASVNYFAVDDDVFIPWVSFGWPWSYGHQRSAPGVGYNNSVINNSVNWGPFVGQQGGGGLGGRAPLIPSYRDYWRIDEIENVKVTMLIANLFVGVAISGAFAGLWEWQRRYRRKRWQFSLADGMIGLTLFAACLGLWHVRYHGDFTVKTRLQRAVAGARGANRLTLSHDDLEIERNWFWETLGVPADQRPCVLRSLSLANANPIVVTPDGSGVDLRTYPMPDPAGTFIGQLRNLKTLRLESVSFSPAGWREIATDSTATNLTLNRNGLGDRESLELAKFQHLKYLSIENNPLSDVGLSAYSGNKHLSIICLTNTPNITGRRLADFRNVAYYRFCGVGINGNALSAISQKRIHELTIDHCPEIEFADWEQLGNPEGLQRLTIRNTRFNDESAAAIARLTYLQDIVLEGTELTDSGVRDLRCEWWFDDFTLIDHSGRITDKTLYYVAEKLQGPRLKRMTKITLRAASRVALQAAQDAGIDATAALIFD